MNLICNRAYHSAGSDRGLDLSNLNKWVNGTGQRNGFRIVNDYYRDPRSAKGLAEDIETLLLDSVADLPIAITKNISSNRKSGTSFYNRQQIQT